MAFADGELTPDERMKVEDALQRDDTLRRRLRVFERTGRALGVLYTETLDQPVPAHILERVRAAKVEAGTPGPLERMAERLRAGLGALSLPGHRWATASVAAGLFIGGLALGVWLERDPAQMTADRHPLLSIESNHLWARGALQETLERVSSGDAGVWSGVADRGGRIVPVLTFKDKTDRYCREYAVTGTPEAAAVGIACRGDKGRWSIEIHIARPTGEEATATFRPASGVGIERLNALMAEMSAGAPIDMDREDALIRAGWAAIR